MNGRLQSVGGRDGVLQLGDVFLLDTHHGGLSQTVGVYLLPDADGVTLIETGPGSTLTQVERGMAAAGYQVADIRRILVTHIHLDHAGAAGALARASGATVTVHRIGAPHLVDPTRLLASAARIYGEAMGTMWGEMLSLPAEQVRAVEGGERLQVGRRTVEVLYTPGHASHHVAYLLDDGTMFTGDAAGIRLPGSPVIRPALPPPETDLELWEESLARMRAARPTRLLLTHFGEVTDADAHLGAVAERNRLWAQEVLAGLRAGEDEAALTERITRLSLAELRAAGASPEVIERHLATSSAEMTVLGLSRYWRKHHPEALAPQG